MLRLAHPAPRGQATDPPARRRGIPSPSLSLTQEEARHLRASIRNVARLRYGTLAALAGALGVKPNTLTEQRHPSAALAVAVWRITRIPLETLLSAQLAAVPAAKDGAS